MDQLGMVIRRLAHLIIVLSLASFTAAASYTFEFDPDRKIDDAEIIRLDLQARWQYSEGTDIWKSISPPFFFTDQEKIDARCLFRLDSNLANTPLRFVSHGFGCAVRLFLNGNLIHTQPNDFTPFHCEFPGQYLLTDQENELKFELFKPSSEEDGFPAYPMLQKAPEYVGITRPIYVKQTSEEWINHFRQEVRNIGASVSLQYSYDIRLPAITENPVRIEERILNDKDQVIFRRSFRYDQGSNPVRNTVSISKDYLWSPDRPVRLTAQILHLNDANQAIGQRRIPFGIRYLGVAGDNLLLNSEPFKIRGINYHENLLSFEGQNYEQKLKNDLLQIKRMGCNAIRFPHYIPAPRAVEIADSLGLFLFGEIPIWRYPAPLYKSDHLLESAKQSIQNLSTHYSRSAALCGLSLGQQIPLHKATTQKFMLILKRFAESNLNILTLLSSIPGKALPSEPAADIYMFESFGSMHDLTSKQTSFLLDGNISIIQSLRRKPDSNTSVLRFQNQLWQELDHAMNLNGGFIEAYKDYYTQKASHISINTNQFPIFPVGLLDVTGEPKIWSRDLITEIWDQDQGGRLEADYPSKQTNLFSILIFFATILFFIYYKQNLRFRDNLKRSLRHPYGFFVDMRERRIIPLLNSIIAGGYYSLVLAVFLSSFIIFYNDSLYLEEILSALFVGTHFYTYYLEMSQSLSYSILFCFLFFFAYPIVFGIILKFFSIFSRQRIRFRQGLAIGFWSGAPFLFIAPISLVAYHLLDMGGFENYMIYLFIFFLLWAHYRIIHGIRVLFASKFRKVLIILLLSYGIPLIIFWAILKPDQYWYEYIRLLLEAQRLY